jgi:hypothetical protein
MNATENFDALSAETADLEAHSDESGAPHEVVASPVVTAVDADDSSFVLIDDAHPACGPEREQGCEAIDENGDLDSTVEPPAGDDEVAAIPVSIDDLDALEADNASDFDALVQDVVIEDGRNTDEAAKAETIRAVFRKSSGGHMAFTGISVLEAMTTQDASGAVQFTVESRHLKEAAETILMTTAKCAPFNLTHITVGLNRLRLCTFNQVAFSEVMIPLATQCAVEDAEEVSFTFDAARLGTIAQAFPQTTLIFSYDAERCTLEVTDTNTGSCLNPGSTGRPERFPDYQAKLGAPARLRPVKPGHIRKAVQYVGQFVRKDDVQDALSIIDFRNGQAVGGTLQGVAVYTSPEFDALNIRVKYSNFPIFDAMLARMDDWSAALFDTNAFHLIRDDNTCFGFEKTTHEFPDITRFFATMPNEIIRMPRSELLHRLRKIECGTTQSNPYVHLRVTGEGPDVKVRLTLAGRHGESGTTMVSTARRESLDGLPLNGPWVCNVALRTFRKAVEAFDSVNVSLSILGGTALLIRDEGENFDATTVLAFVSNEAIKAHQAGKPG